MYWVLFDLTHRLTRLEAAQFSRGAVILQAEPPTPIPRPDVEPDSSRADRDRTVRQLRWLFKHPEHSRRA